MRIRRGLVWVLSVPLMLAGSQAAHALAYRIAYPQAGLRARALLATGHSYLDLLPRLLGVGLGVELVVLLLMVRDRSREGPARGLPAWAFATLPAVAFTIQEVVERLLLLHTVPWWMFAQPTFRIGLLLQLPVGLVVYLIARLLLRGVAALARVLARRRAHPVDRRPRVAGPRPNAYDARSLAVPERGWGLRGPPSLVI